MISPNAKPKSLELFPSISASSSSLPYLFSDLTFVSTPNPSDLYFFLKASFFKIQASKSEDALADLFFKKKISIFPMRIFYTVVCGGSWLEQLGAVVVIKREQWPLRQCMGLHRSAGIKLSCLTGGYRKCFHPNMQATGRSERERSTRESHKPQCGFYRHASSPGRGNRTAHL